MIGTAHHILRWSN